MSLIQRTSRAWMALLPTLIVSLSACKPKLCSGGTNQAYELGHGDGLQCRYNEPGWSSRWVEECDTAHDYIDGYYFGYHDGCRQRIAEGKEACDEGPCDEW